MTTPFYPPAPWEAIGRTVRGAYFMGDPERAGIEVCTIPLHIPEEEAARIAKAIAALPELLGALGDLHKWHHTPEQGSICCQIATVGALYAAAGAALAKAQP